MTDIDLFGEYIVQLLTDALTSGDDVDIAYVDEHNEDLGTVVGRKVRVYGLGYLSEEPATRREDFYDLNYGIAVFERYQPDAATPTAVIPPDWLAERKLYVEEKVFNILANSRVMYDPSTSGESEYQYWSQFAEVTVYIDRNLLKSHKVFWSELQFTFRKLKT